MARPQGNRGRSRVREKPAQEYAEKPGASGLSGVLLDTDVIIRVLRGYADVRAALAALDRRGVRTYTTAIAWAEVHAGLRRGEEAAAETFFRTCGEVVLDSHAGRAAGDYLARFRRSHSLELPDALVAAAASTSALHLWTLNRKHFPMRDVRFFTPE